MDENSISHDAPLRANASLWSRLAVTTTTSKLEELSACEKVVREVSTQTTATLLAYSSERKMTNSDTRATQKHMVVFVFSFSGFENQME